MGGNHNDIHISLCCLTKPVHFLQISLQTAAVPLWVLGVFSWTPCFKRNLVVLWMPLSCQKSLGWSRVSSSVLLHFFFYRNCIFYPFLLGQKLNNSFILYNDITTWCCRRDNPCTFTDVPCLPTIRLCIIMLHVCFVWHTHCSGLHYSKTWYICMAVPCANWLCSWKSGELFLFWPVHPTPFALPLKAECFLQPSIIVCLWTRRLPR